MLLMCMFGMRARITDLEVDKLIARLGALDIQVTVDEEARNYISRKGYDPQYGARPLKRAVQTYLEDELSEMLIEDAIESEQTINVTYDKETDKLKYERESGGRN